MINLPSLFATTAFTLPSLFSPGYHVRGFGMRPYQIRAAHKVFTGTPTRDFNTGAYLGVDCDGTNVHIDMGLGKTIIGLTAISDWFRFGILNRPVLIVAPIKVCQTVWRQEAKAWSHTRHLVFGDLTGNEKQRAFELARGFDYVTKKRLTHVFIINPEKLAWLYKYLREDWSYFDAIIIDDVALKDRKSKQFRTLSNYGRRDVPKDPLTGKAMKDADGHWARFPPHRFKRAAKLTGTPSTTGLIGVWAPNYLMDHGARLHKQFDTYEARFFHKAGEVADHVYRIDLNAEEAESRPVYIAKEEAPSRIHELIADITIELDAREYGVLPQTLGDASKGNPDELYPGFIHRVELPDEYRTQYDKLEKEAIIELAGDTVMAQNGGAKSLMCWQIANGAIYKNDDFGQQEVHELHNAKLDKLVELIDTLNTNVVVPYYFKHDFARIVARLQKEGMSFAALSGRNSERIIDQWNGGYTPILLLHPQSAGHGLNLQFGGHTLLWFTMLWSLERYLQTNARLARSGQSGIVGIHSIVTSRTTDELMLINLRQNGSAQDRFRAAIREYQEIRGIRYV